VSDIDPTKMSKEQLLVEWSVREEELRTQFETIKEAERQGSALLSRFRRLFEASPTPTIVMDSRGFVEEWNAPAQECFPVLCENFLVSRLFDTASASRLREKMREECYERSHELQLNAAGDNCAMNAELVALGDDPTHTSFALFFDSGRLESTEQQAD